MALGMIAVVLLGLIISYAKCLTIHIPGPSQEALALEVNLASVSSAGDAPQTGQGSSGDSLTIKTLLYSNLITGNLYRILAFRLSRRLGLYNSGLGILMIGENILGSQILTLIVIISSSYICIDCS